MKRGFWILLMVVALGFLGTELTFAGERREQTATAPAGSSVQMSLIKAIAARNMKEVKAALAKGADVNAKDRSSSEYDGDEDGHDRTPLHDAVLNYGHNSPKIIELLIAKGADVNAVDLDGATPLHYALGRRPELDADAKIVSDIAILLIASGANIGAKHGMDGGTPLHMAVESGYRVVAMGLLSKAADVDARDKSGETPLFRVITDVSMARLLLDHGADVNAKDAGGETPFSYALAHNWIDVAEFMLARGADVKARNNEGVTPLHYAAAGGPKRLVESVIAKGADVNAKDRAGRTPLAYAQSRKDIADVLRAHGAKEFGTK